MGKALGRLIILDLYGCDPAVLDDRDRIEEIVIGTAKACRVTELKTVTHKFTPHGVTAIMVIAESHISIHSWPERKYVAVDIFVCGEDAKPNEGAQYVREQLKCEKSVSQEIPRGILSLL